MGRKRVFELNPEHPLIKRLSTDVDGEHFDDWTRKWLTIGKLFTVDVFSFLNYPALLS